MNSSYPAVENMQSHYMQPDYLQLQYTQIQSRPTKRAKIEKVSQLALGDLVKIKSTHKFSTIAKKTTQKFSTSRKSASLSTFDRPKADKLRTEDIFSAIDKSAIETVRALYTRIPYLIRGKALNQQIDSGMTPIMRCVVKNFKKGFYYFLCESEIDLFIKDNNKDNVLSLAIKLGRVDIVKFLFNSLKMNIHDMPIPKGMSEDLATPLKIAALANQDEMALFLLKQKETKFDGPDRFYSLIVGKCFKTFQQCFSNEELIAKFTITIFDLNDALMNAVQQGSFLFVKEALRLGANPNAFRIDESPLKQAMHLGNSKIADLLIENGAENYFSDSLFKSSLESVDELLKTNREPITRLSIGL